MDQEMFDAALAAKVASIEEETPTEEPTEDTQDSLDLEEAYQEEFTEEEEPEGDERLRDDKGRFLPKFDDPDVEEYIERFGGDIGKALRSAVEAQSLIGRQGSELGELRKLVEGLTERFDSRNEVAPPVPSFRGDIEEALEETPDRVAQYAIQTQDPQLYEAALRNWYDIDPFSASRFERSLEIERLKSEFQGILEPAVAPVKEQEQIRAFQAAQNTLIGRHPDFGDVMESATERDFEGFPNSLARQLQDGNAEEKAEALESMYRWVKASKVASQEQARTERATKKKAEKKDAFAASSTSTQTAREDTGVSQFKKSLLEPEPYSVRHGLGES